MIEKFKYVFIVSINIRNEGLRLILEEIIKTIPDGCCHGLRCAGIGSKVLTFNSLRVC